jgi:hypothetical protein
MLELLFTISLATLAWPYAGEPLWDEVYYSQPIYLDVKGEQMVTLQLVDKICNPRDCVDGFYDSGTNTISIVQGKFGHTPSAMYFENYQGCTPFLHERWHSIHGDYTHKIMPFGCEGVW